MPKGFSEHEKKVIRDLLLEQGAKQFAAHGLRKCTVEELAASAGISKGAFYLFYESKEALFMDVVEQAEMRFREEVLAVIDLPGPSAQARLFAVLHKSFTLWRNIPILRVFTVDDYALLSRRVHAEQLQEHLANDRRFIEDLVTRCRRAEIPIQVKPEQLDSLLHAVFFSSLHEEDFGPSALSPAIDLLLKLIVAYCLGDVVIQFQEGGAVPISQAKVPK